MIAKPTKITLPLAVLLVITLTFLGWMFDHKKTQTDGTQTPSSENSNQARANRQSAEPQRARHLRPANINTKKRLQALYLKYPELAIEFKDPEKSLLKIYEDLFPEDDSNALSAEIEVFEALLKKKTPWSDEEKQLAIDFLAKEQERLNVMMNHTDSSYHFQNDNGVTGFQTFLFPAFRLLTTSFALQLKLENVAQAERTYRSTNQIMQLTQNGCLIDLTSALITHPQLNTNLLASSEELPERTLQILLEDSNNSANYKELIKAEVANTLVMVYRFCDRNDHEELVMEQGAGLPEIPLDDIEQFVAENSMEKIHQIQQYEQSQGDFETFIQLLNTPPSTELANSSEDFKDMFFSGHGIYYDAIHKFKFISEVQKTAIQIALVQSRGETFTGDLPHHYKTGKPIIWDKENNLLRTGIEAKEHQDHSTINIPSLRSNDE